MGTRREQRGIESCPARGIQRRAAEVGRPVAEFHNPVDGVGSICVLARRRDRCRKSNRLAGHDVYRRGDQRRAGRIDDWDDPELG